MRVIQRVNHDARGRKARSKARTGVATVFTIIFGEIWEEGVTVPRARVRGSPMNGGRRPSNAGWNEEGWGSRKVLGGLEEAWMGGSY